MCCLLMRCNFLLTCAICSHMSADTEGQRNQRGRIRVSALHTRAASAHRACVCVLTLICCSLFATRRSSICFFLAVALQRAEGQLRASGCLHLWQKLRVAHSSGCAIAVADGGCNVTAYLRCTECTCPACALLALQ
jgi:hypothetical protein